MINVPDDSFRSPAFKRGVKHARNYESPSEATPEYLKGYAEERVRLFHDLNPNTTRLIDGKKS